jgi:hypothetical protein
MSRFSTHALVVANPWFAMDHRGRPCGAVPIEPAALGSHLGFVGAKVDRDKSKGGAQLPGFIAPPAHDPVFIFSDKPVKVRRSPYYLQLLKKGKLFPADESTARWCGVDFKPLAALLTASRNDAEAKFERAYGEGALADLRQQTAIPAPVDAPPVAAVNAAPAEALKENKPPRGNARKPNDKED